MDMLGTLEEYKPHARA